MRNNKGKSLRFNKELIEKNKILEAIVNKIENNFQEDISILMCYGSYITGEYNNLSDIDFFFIPKTEKGYNLSYQFIIDNIGYDLWFISWERANRIANLDEQLISIIMDGEILYCFSNKDFEKISNLKKNIIKNLLNKKIISKRINKLLSEIKSNYFDINQVSEDEYIAQVYSILEKLLFAIALLNGEYLVKGIKNIENEIKRFAIVPQDFLKDYYDLINFENKAKVNTILLKMINMFSDLNKSYFENENQKPDPNELIGFYEEFKSTYNKLIQACKSKKFAMAIYFSVLINRETNDFLKQYMKTENFPELTGYILQKNYQHALELCKKHEDLLIKLLNDNNVSINNFENVDVFAKHFQSQKLDK